MRRTHYPVPGKVSARYITRSEKRTARADQKLFEFLLYFYAGKESPAKKAFALIKGRGLGTLEMFVIADQFEEWWESEKHRRAGKNSKKAVRAKAEKRNARDDEEIATYIRNCIKRNTSLGFR
jgi:hypothetical protein